MFQVLEMVSITDQLTTETGFFLKDVSYETYHRTF